MKAFVIAGGVPQAELLQQLNERGIVTVLADGNPNAVARPHADMFYHVDIFDVAAIRKIAVEEAVDFLITVCADQVLLVVAQVSEELGLPCYLDYKTAQNVSDKLKMKRIFKEAGIPTTKYVKTASYEEIPKSGLTYPLVVKPVDTYSSKGVRRADNPEELAKYYEEAKAISRSGGVIVEEYFEGEEISVDGFVVNGKAHILTTSCSDKIENPNRFVIFRGRYPADISKPVEQKITMIAQQIADAFGLVNAPLLIQLLVKDEELSVLEFCARTGGNMKWVLIKNACGVDVIDATIDITLGINPDLTVHDTGHNLVVNDFLYCYPGVFDHFEGVTELVEQGVINEFYPVRAKGTVMNDAMSSSDRIAGANIVAASKEEFNAKQTRIYSSVKVVDEAGNDILRRDIINNL